MAKLTEPQAWRAIAAKLEHFEFYRMRPDGRLSTAGLCAEVIRMGDDDRISEKTVRMMDDRIERHMEAMCLSSCVFAWPVGHVSPRILACHFLAIEAESEPTA